MILSQSVYATDGILKTEQVLGLFCQPHCFIAILKLKYWLRTAVIKQIYYPQSYLALTLTLWWNHYDEITLWYEITGNPLNLSFEVGRAYWISLFYPKYIFGEIQHKDIRCVQVPYSMARTPSDPQYYNRSNRFGPNSEWNPQLSHCQWEKDRNATKSLPSHHQNLKHLTIATLKIQQVWWVLAE